MASSSSERATTNANPGTPWMHLLADEIMKSTPVLSMSKGMPQNADIESRMSRFPKWRVSRPSVATSFTMPVVVSQWTSPT